MRFTWESTSLVEEIDIEGLTTVGEARVLVGGRKLGTRKTKVLDDEVLLSGLDSETVYIRNILTVKYLSGVVEHVNIDGMISIADLKDRLGDDCRVINEGKDLANDYPLYKVKEPVYIVTIKPGSMTGHMTGQMTGSVQLTKPKNIGAVIDELMMLRKELVKLECAMGVSSDLDIPSVCDNKFDYAIKEVQYLRKTVQDIRGKIHRVDEYQTWWSWTWSWFW